MSEEEDYREQNGSGEPEKISEQQHANVKMKSPLSDSASTDNSDTQLSCKVCRLLRGSVNMLTKHAWTHVDGLNNLCGVCGEQTESAEELRRHLNTHQKTQTCNICGKSFLTAVGFKGHMDVHKGNKPHKCKICHKAFAVKSVLKTHQWIHMKDKPHKCDVCQESFSSPVKLKIHRFSHAAEKNERERETVSQPAVAPPSSSAVSTVVPIPCEFCSKKFYTEIRLESHMRRHQKRTFSCTACDKMFVFKTALINHMKVHTDLNHFSCLDCGMVFNQWATWKQHQEDQHPHGVAPGKRSAFWQTK